MFYGVFMWKKMKVILGIFVLILGLGVIGKGMLERNAEYFSSDQDSEGIEIESAISQEENTEVTLNGMKVVIDPGHGGYDPRQSRS